MRNVPAVTAASSSRFVAASTRTSTATGWLQWKDGYRLAVPSQAFDSGPGISSVSFEHANSAYLCDASTLAGHYYYLLYAGSNELSQFGGGGHAEIGIARHPRRPFRMADCRDRQIGARIRRCVENQ